MAIFEDPKGFLTSFPRPFSGRLLGFDVGDKTIGLSLSDPGWMIASPLQTLRRKTKEQDRQTLKSLFQTYAIQGSVIGLPVNMNGSEGPQAEKTRHFVTEFLTEDTLPLLLWDERLSTQGATLTLLEADLSRARRRQVVDKVAATLILQSALDALGRLSNMERP